MLSKLAQPVCMASRRAPRQAFQQACQLCRLSDQTHPLHEQDSMVKLVEEVQQLNRQLYNTRADIRLELIKINTELNESKKKITAQMFWMDFNLGIIAVSSMVVAVKL